MRTLNCNLNKWNYVNASLILMPPLNDNEITKQRRNCLPSIWDQ